MGLRRIGRARTRLSPLRFVGDRPGVKLHRFVKVQEYRGFPKLSGSFLFLGGRHNKDYSILGSALRPPNVWKLAIQAVEFGA